MQYGVPVKNEYGGGGGAVYQGGDQGGYQQRPTGMGMGGGMRRQPEDFKEGKIFIGALSYDTTQQSLEGYCVGWGQVQDTFVMDKKGYGFITFANIEDAFRFLEHQNHVIDGRTVEVKAAVPKSKGGGGKPTKKLFVGGVPREVTNEELKAHFSQYGDIEDAAIVADQSGVSRGFGFVTYTDPICIEKALIVKHMLHDRQVDCKRAVPKDDMRGGGEMRQQGGYGMGGMGGGMGMPSRGMGGGMGAYGMNPMSMGGYGMYAAGYGAMANMGGYGAYAQQDTRGMGGYGQMGGGMGGYGQMGGDAGGYGRAGGRGGGRQDRYQPY